jgi:hypothetical protein
MFLPFVLAAHLLFPAPLAHAATSIGGDTTTGQDYRGFDVKGRLNLDPDAVYSLNAQYAHVDSTLGTPTRSNQIVLGIDHLVEDDWDFNGGLTGWKDDVSDVKYIGPSFGFVYTLYRDAKTGGSSDADRETAAEPRDVDDQILDVVYNSNLFFYQTGVNTSTHSITQGSGKEKKTIIVPPVDSAFSLFQFNPSVELDAPLFGGKVTPSILAGHYFYSQNPANIQQVAGLPTYTAVSVNGMTGLVGGLLENNGQIGLDVLLPWNTRLHGSLGLEQLAVDNSWATTQGITFTALMFDRRLKGLFAWNRSIQEGVTQDLYTFGLTVLFY